MDIHHAPDQALVLVIVWVGALKYTSYEAADRAQPGLQLALQHLQRACLRGGARQPGDHRRAARRRLATAPGVTVPSAGGFPVLSVMPGQFLLKDLVLVGASLWTLGDSLSAALPWRGARDSGKRSQ